VHSAAKLTIRQWFTTYFRPWFLVRRSPKTVAEYSCTLDRWEQLSSNRPIKEIRGEHLMAWRARLVELHGRRRIDEPAVAGRGPVEIHDLALVAP